MLGTSDYSKRILVAGGIGSVIKKRWQQN